MRNLVALSLILVAAATCRCKEEGRPRGGDSAVEHARLELGQVEKGAAGWTVAHEERFEGTELGKPSWVVDPVPDDGPFADNGAYFKKSGISAPKAYRISQPVGASGWLTVEAYSRSNATAYASLVSIIEDPSQAGNKVLRLATPEHTDAVVIRPSQPLPDRYRVSLRVGHASYGDGKEGLNGYDGGERAEPWVTDDATSENGFYWLTILDSLPRPHNNVWIHHHRKIVVDSDNHYPAWMQIWNGQSFLESGERPIMLFALDGQGKVSERTGKPFISYSSGTWQPSGEIRAVDRYKPGTWYQVSITREGDRFSVQLKGDFEFGGQRSYSAELDAAARCIYHYNRAPLPAGSPCGDSSHYPSLPDESVIWAPATPWPDYFMFGDPHNNFYEGQVLYDDLRLEVWRP